MELSSRNAFLVLRTYLKNAKPEKYEHSMRVAAISQFLAQIWGESVTDAIIAAMLHDIGKSMSEQQITSLCMRNNIEVHDFDLLETRMALHGKVSALLFQREFEGNDSERMNKIAHAISSHVAGDERMNLLDKIIFIADNVESKTEGIELLEQIKSGQIDGPNECVRRIIEQKKERNRQKGLEYIPFLDATLEALEKDLDAVSKAMELSSRNAFLVLRTYLKNAKPEKYEHSMRVAAISQFLAQIWGESVTDAIIAAMLHDIGKSMSEQQITSLCMRNNIEVHDFDLLETRMALHGKVSALLFQREFEGNDSERMNKIAHAISSHVAGDERMNLLDKIIFIADNVESKTEGIELLEQIKSGQINGPNECVRRIIEQKKERNRQKGLEYIPFLDVTLEALKAEGIER